MSRGPAAFLEARGLVKSFPQPRRAPWGRRTMLRVLDGVDLAIYHGETVGLVGGSGSGKSTLARCCLRLLRPESGQVLLDGTDVFALRGRAVKSARRRMQVVFQDPFGSLDPRMTAEDVVGEGLVVHRLAAPAERRGRVAALLRRVGLAEDALGRYPHEFSAGQRQRLAIARALAVEPELLVLDEPVSALDVSVQAQVLNLLLDLKEERRIACLFISHDLAVVAQMSDRIAVLHEGRIVECAPAEAVLRQPEHSYTRDLVRAAGG